MLQVFYCNQCKTNVLEEAWDADKQKCKRCAAHRHKYNAVKTKINGITFDSRKEAEHYFALKTREQAGEIADLQLQPRFPIIVNGQTVAHYIADFQYVDLSSSLTVIVDVKSQVTRTPIYRLKKKLVEALYPIQITEV